MAEHSFGLTHGLITSKPSPPNNFETSLQWINVLADNQSNPDRCANTNPGLTRTPDQTGRTATAYHMRLSLRTLAHSGTLGLS